MLHLSESEYADLTGQKVKTNKYHNSRCVWEGIKFQSIKEMNRWVELQLLYMAGVIQDLRRQVKFELIPKQSGQRACNYYADFVYIEQGKLVIEDVKSKATATAVYKLKKKLMAAMGYEIRET
jgi:hypothetical protein